MIFWAVVSLAAAAEVRDLFISRVVQLRVHSNSSLHDAAITAAQSFGLADSIIDKFTSRVWMQSMQPWDSEPPAVRGYQEGAMLAGVSCVEGSATLEIMDPRGHNPPFGHVYQFRLEPGDLVMFWAGQPFAIPPTGSALLARVELGFFGLTSATRAHLMDLDPLAFLSTRVST